MGERGEMEGEMGGGEREREAGMVGGVIEREG